MDNGKGKRSFSEQIGTSEKRKIKARRQPPRSIWRGFAVFGLIGWSVAAPTIIGAMLGLWLDRRYPAAHSWTLTMLVAGLVIGCLTAWRWIADENKNMHKDG